MPTSPLSPPPRRSGSLARRFALNFGALLALFVIVAGVSQTMMSRVAGQARDIVEVNNQQMALANTMIGEVDEIAIAVRTLTLLTGIMDVEKQVTLLDQATARYVRTERELAAAFETNGANATQRALLAQIEEVRKTTLPLITQAARLGADGATPEATLVLMNDVRPVEQRWRRLVGELIALETRSNAAAYEAVRRTERLATIGLVGVALLAVLIGAVLAWRLGRSIVPPVVDATRLAERIAQGDLSGRIESERTDELGRLLRAIAAMQERLRALVGDIRGTADQISTASAEIATGNHDLSDRTEKQAASLQKTASSIAQLSSTVRLNADSARQADRLASSASEIAARGGQVVGEVVTTMADISASSKKIADIIGVIDGIAFQTNILALNAAVEAARAGEQGRGFAVVASEVRSLAGRSAGAAREIKALIVASGERVDTGARLVGAAGGTMSEIVASIERVTAIVSSITASTQEQSGDIAQVSGEVGELDQMTQQNAAMVQQSATATEGLKLQAQAMAQSVRAFRLSTDAT